LHDILRCLALAQEREGQTVSRFDECGDRPIETGTIEDNGMPDSALTRCVSADEFGFEYESPPAVSCA
jgi:hypothetical protein